jgi:outer membrane lipoprotein-sorting protein
VSPLLLAALLLIPGRALAAKKSAVPPAQEILRRSAEPRAASYRGVMLVETFSGGKTEAKRVSVRFQRPGLYRREVLDAAGRPVLTVVSDGKTEWVHEAASNRAWKSQAPEAPIKRQGPKAEFELLADNFEASAATAEPVAGRPAWRVDLRAKSDGALRRRLWVDAKTGLVLGAEELSPEGTRLSCTRFESLEFPGRQPKKDFAFAAPPGVAVAERSASAALGAEKAAAAAGFSPLLPGWLPSGLVLESHDVLPKGSAKLLHSRFSDGVTALSLFQGPASVTLDSGGKPGTPLRVGSSQGTLTATADGQALSWDSGGRRFLLVGPLAAQTLARIGASLR